MVILGGDKRKSGIFTSNPGRPAVEIFGALGAANEVGAFSK